MTFITRFAPSPTGPLHLGHAYSALLAFDQAQENNGTFLLRIEDIDQSRSRPEWVSKIYEDLAWLGITWPRPVLHQAAQIDQYHEALKTLWKQNLLYVCSCNRRDIRDAVSAPQEDIQFGPDGIIYPGTCRHKPNNRAGDMPLSVLRLDIQKALEHIQGPIEFLETGVGPNGETGLQTLSHKKIVDTIGDIVLARKDMGTSYHLSVVVDDYQQRITQITRGQDLYDATYIHVILQKLIGYTSPKYCHHKLIRDTDGKRLAKRHDAKALFKFRDDGYSPDDIRKVVGLS